MSWKEELEKFRKQILARMIHTYHAYYEYNPRQDGIIMSNEIKEIEESGYYFISVFIRDGKLYAFFGKNDYWDL